jgi:serine/threonine-protein kinase RIO1
VHADFSEYNILLHEGELVVIDVSQAVEHAHPHALEFLRMDINNVNDFFGRKVRYVPRRTRGDHRAVALEPTSTFEHAHAQLQSRHSLTNILAFSPLPSDSDQAGRARHDEPRAVRLCHRHRSA